MFPKSFFLIILFLGLLPLGSCSTVPQSVALPAEAENKSSGGEGWMRIAWNLQTQEDVYGFYIYRGISEKGPFEIANEDILPGHGTTALPKAYEFFDTGLEIGKEYFYYVTEVSTSGYENKFTPIFSSDAKPRDYYVEKGHLENED